MVISGLGNWERRSGLLLQDSVTFMYVFRATICHWTTGQPIGILFYREEYFWGMPLFFAFLLLTFEITVQVQGSREVTE